MEFQVTYLEKEKIIVSRLSEYYDWTVAEKMVPALSVLIKEKSCKHILLNFATANMKLSTINIYMTPDKLATEFLKYGVDIRQLRRAMVVAKDENDYRFLANVTVNQSQLLRIFHDEDSAINWLME
ncbi:hypothetical protein SDC9_160789 [bioreactor metagenome]|uniref:STAS/SEC14 domain-containing protein n=1 Tax=bioreactor metagenome TaxID=1076179 RepID=A0A645FGF4_9ZZZZ